MTNKSFWKLSKNNFLKTLGSRLEFDLRFLCGSRIRSCARVRFATNPFQRSMFVAFVTCHVHSKLLFFYTCTFRSSHTYGVVTSFDIIRLLTSQSGRVWRDLKNFLRSIFCSPPPLPKRSGDDICKSDNTI